jgi:cytochrome o ubiquinol oxidase operon protein cyoD
MKDAQDTSKAMSDAGQSTLISYVLGFSLSVLLTLAAYLSVANHALMGKSLVLVIAGLAVVQLFVQLLFFLHLGRESRPRWNLLVFSFMLLVVGIVVGGSLWIMDNLNYHMTSRDIDTYIHNEEGIHQ